MNNKKIKKVCIITDSYPTDKVPRYTFVEQLVLAWSRLGIECVVLNPVSLTNVLIRGGELKPRKWETINKSGKVQIYSPRYLTYTMKKKWKLNFAEYTINSYKRCCMRFIKKHIKEFDVIYAHFIPSGIVASNITKVYGVPSFFAYGENTTYSIEYLGEKNTRKLLKDINGVISVSSYNKKVLEEKRIAKSNNIEVFPNGIDTSLFYKRNKIEMRKKYNIPEESFIVIFVGYFIDIKGPDRVSKAIDKLSNEKIKSIFIGEGEIEPSCEGIIIKGKQKHNIIPELLSAADVFVLPTLAEGCCNSIIEAMSCGLPIISSKNEFNDDIIDETCSIRINPNDIDEIAEAINLLYKNVELRDRLSIGALKKSAPLNLDNRAENILEFMKKKLEETICMY